MFVGTRLVALSVDWEAGALGMLLVPMYVSVTVTVTCEVLNAVRVVVSSPKPLPRVDAEELWPGVTMTVYVEAADSLVEAGGCTP